MDKIKWGVGRDIFFDIFKHPLLILSINFNWRLKITKGILEIKFSLIFQLFLIQSFLKNIILLWQIEVWSSILNMVPLSWQWAVKLSSSNCPISFEDSWLIMDFIIKTISLPHFLQLHPFECCTLHFVLKDIDVFHWKWNQPCHRERMWTTTLYIN